MAVSFGGWVMTTVFSTTVGSFTAGLIGGALIGAAVGGIGAAIMGGDIMKGVLFGAVGGAVMGGMQGYFAAGDFGTSGLTDTAIGGGGYGEYIPTSQGAAYGGVPLEATKKVVEEGSKGFLGKIGDETMGALVTGGIGLVGDTMQGMGAEEQWKAEAEMRISEAEKDRKLQMDMLNKKLEAGSAGGGSSGAERDYAAELAENARQFNEELAQRKIEFEKTMGIRKDELYAPMEYEKERKRRAGAALSSVRMERGEYSPSESIFKQVTESNTDTYKPPVQANPTPQPQPQPQEQM